MSADDTTSPALGDTLAAAAPAGAWGTGQRVGRYVVRDKLGRGGMGAVYRADDMDLARPVALKRLHGGADTEGRARLVREARTAAQLSHPNVVAVYEVGEAEGTPYLAMELVEGETLTAWLAKGRSWREIVAMFVQAGRGLNAAHDRGLVHRDFKPDNVLVDRTGRARVADFGLARARDGEGGARATDPKLARMTETGAISGTPAYMAPELVEGSAPNHASDQYAFCVSLYEALRGQHPFEGSSAAALWVEMASGRIREGGRAIPGWLDRLVRRGMAVDPFARWGSIGGLLDALEHPPRRVWPWIAGGAGIAAVAIGIAVALVMSSKPPPPAPAPVARGSAPPAEQPQPPSSDDPKEILHEAGLLDMQGQYSKAGELAEQVLEKDPKNDWARKLVVLEACRIHHDLKYEHGTAQDLAELEQLAHDTNIGLTPLSRGSLHSECDRDGIWLEGDVEDVGTHKQWHADARKPDRQDKAKPEPEKQVASSTKETLNEIGMSYHDDPAKSLAEVEAIIKAEPANQFAKRLSVIVACDLTYKLQRKRASPPEIAAAEAKARALAEKLTPHDRWLVWSECDRWANIRLEGDVDHLGDGHIEHIGPKP